MNYTGEKCSACNEVFKDDDDVVVCPECGTPHHRACYKMGNHCVNISKHSADFRWTTSSEQEKPDEEKQEELWECPICHNENSESSEQCTGCGARRIVIEPNRADDGNVPPNLDSNALSYLGFNPNEDMGGSTLGEVSSFVATNTIYYIPIFKKMKALGKKASLNLSCFIFPWLYFANRRMWLWAILVGTLSIIFSLPATIMALSDTCAGEQWAEGFVSAVNQHYRQLQELNEVLNVGDIVMRALLCLFGNWIYFRYVLSSIKKLRAKGTDTASGNHAALKEAGGVKPVNMLIILGIMLVVSLALTYLFTIFII